MHTGDDIVRRFNDKEVVVGCTYKHSSGVSVFYFVYGKGTKNKMSFNFVVN